MRILLLGARGQVGMQLESLYKQRADVELFSLNSSDLDLADRAAIDEVIAQCAPNWLINAAAYTAVDAAESDIAGAFAINARAPEQMAQSCAKIGAKMLHYSTDYVFDGNATKPYLENAETAPQGVYGESKLAGEIAVQKYLPQSFILRTAWVYSDSGKNFLNTMLRLANERDEIAVVADQVGSPTLAADLARVSVAMIDAQNDAERDRWGIYHACGQGQCSWHEFAEQIMQLSDNGHITVNAIATEQYPTPAQRPAYSVLDNNKLEQHFALALAPWQAALTSVLRSE